MGWLFRNQPLTTETPAEYLTRQFTHDGEQRKAEVLAASQVGGTVYMAIRNTEKATGKSYVFAAIILVKNNRRDGFGYKDMDEGMGPCEVACPDRIMKLLTPIEQLPNPSYATDWRERVVAYKQAKRDARKRAKALLPGDIIRTVRPIRYRDIAVDTFKMIPTPHRRRGPIFQPLGHHFLCRIPSDDLATATRLPPPVLP